MGPHLGVQWGWGGGHWWTVLLSRPGTRSGRRSCYGDRNPSLPFLLFSLQDAMLKTLGPKVLALAKELVPWSTQSEPPLPVCPAYSCAFCHQPLPRSLQDSLSRSALAHSTNVGLGYLTSFGLGVCLSSYPTKGFLLPGIWYHHL